MGPSNKRPKRVVRYLTEQSIEHEAKLIQRLYLSEKVRTRSDAINFALSATVDMFKRKRRKEDEKQVVENGSSNA